MQESTKVAVREHPAYRRRLSEVGSYLSQELRIWPSRQEQMTLYIRGTKDMDYSQYNWPDHTWHDVPMRLLAGLQVAAGLRAHLTAKFRVCGGGMEKLVAASLSVTADQVVALFNEDVKASPVWAKFLARVVAKFEPWRVEYNRRGGDFGPVEGDDSCATFACKLDQMFGGRVDCVGGIEVLRGQTDIRSGKGVQ